MKHRTINTWNTNLYLLNLALLATHEIDSAFWNEWKLFGLPGGIQEFLVANFLLMLIMLLGFRNMICEKRSGLYFALIASGSGIFAFGIHTYFILRGRPEFTLLISLVILIATMLVSLLQGVLSIQGLRKHT